MKKKGFTLIELLAVIVVLAIIALIATPIVMNVIKDAQKGAVERSAERYIKAVETAIATDMLQHERVKDGIYNVDENGDLDVVVKTLSVEVDGDIPEAESKVAIQNGQVVKDGTNLNYGDYTVKIDDKGSATATEKRNVVVLCTATAPSEQNLYLSEGTFPVTTTIAGVQATSDAPYALGAEYTCELGDGVSRTFYVLGTNGDNVKLIMNEHLMSSVAWAKNSDDIEPTEANETLANSTRGWKKLFNTGGKVELPDAQDVANAMGDTEWADNNYTGVTGPTWLYVNCDNYDRLIGYWTSTLNPEKTSSAWGMDYHGALCSYAHEIVNGALNGIRPVIVISKDNMSL